MDQQAAAPGAEAALAEGVDPAARWPQGWNAVEQARGCGCGEAAAAATDKTRWLKGRPGVDWEAIHLQVARGRTQLDVATEYGVSRSSVCERATKHGWVALDEVALRRKAFEVARVGRARQAVTGGAPTDEDIARSCEWTPLPERTPLYQRMQATAPEAFAPRARGDIDHPENEMVERRDRARAELLKAAEVARGCGEAERAEAALAQVDALATERDGMIALTDWPLYARHAQLAPEGAWRTWMLMGGRGAGKTRAGAEWIRALVERGDARRVALIGPTLHDVREVMIEGPSGLKAVASPGMAPEFNVSRRLVKWPNGAVGMVFSAEDPDSLRGPQFDAAWCDEIGAWPRDEKTWDTMMFALRTGPAPRVAATTTPRARKLVRRLHDLADKARGGVVLTRAATKENAANLAPGFVEAMEESYRGTELALQELDGELITDPPGAMFLRETIEAGRVVAADAGEFERVVVAVDPPAGAGEKAAACGIVCAGVRGKTVYVLEDASVRGMRPAQWAQKAVDVARRRGAGVIVAEANQGGEMVRAVIEAAGAKGEVRVKLRNATKSKRDRAEPVSVEYEAGRVKHVGVLRELEDEMCAFGAQVDGAPAGPSPDRVDAMVWAVSELMKKPPKPGIVVL